MNFVLADFAVESYLLSHTDIYYSVSQQFYKKHEKCCLLYSCSFPNTVFLMVLCTFAGIVSGTLSAFRAVLCSVLCFQSSLGLPLQNLG